MIIARDVKIVPRAAGEWDNTSSVFLLYTTIEQKKNEKNNDKQQFSPVRRVCEKCNKHSLFARS
jgi:hypothetical protein